MMAARVCRIKNPQLRLFARGLGLGQYQERHRKGNAPKGPSGWFFSAAEVAVATRRYEEDRAAREARTEAEPAAEVASGGDGIPPASNARAQAVRYFRDLVEDGERPDYALARARGMAGLDAPDVTRLGPASDWRLRRRDEEATRRPGA